MVCLRDMGGTKLYNTYPIPCRRRRNNCCCVCVAGSAAWFSPLIFVRQHAYFWFMVHFAFCGSWTLDRFRTISLLGLRCTFLHSSLFPVSWFVPGFHTDSSKHACAYRALDTKLSLRFFSAPQHRAWTRRTWFFWFLYRHRAPAYAMGYWIGY